MRLIFTALLLHLISGVLTGSELTVSMRHQFADQRLPLDSLRLTNTDKATFSISRLSYLLSGFSLETEEGQWVELSDSIAWIDVAKSHTEFSLLNIPEGDYRTGNELAGYVYYLPNDPTQINLPLKLDISKDAGIEMVFELATKPTTAPAAPIDLPEEYTPYRLNMSRSFPIPVLPTDNPLIEERIALGEKLFFDTRLSANETISCSSCHKPASGFSDGQKRSTGINRSLTRRHSMPLFNLAWKDRFFWDGRAPSLRAQALEPIENPLEMGEDLDNVVAKLKASYDYPAAFKTAFGSGTISAETIGLALEAYQLTLTSYNSKFDQAMQGKAELSETEKRGFELFMTEFEPRSGHYGADCFHCHGGALFSDHQFHNNGLPITDDDLGLAEISQRDSDRRKFSTPSLRNVALTAPYMHDGRFATLAEVVAHYSSGVEASDTLDPNLAKHQKGGLQLSVDDQAALVAFLRSLTDPNYQDL